MKCNSCVNSIVQLSATFKGFTLIELIFSIAIISIFAGIAVPNFNHFLTKIRVDNEIVQLQRLLATARNTAINTGLPTTLCPLNESKQCHSQWHKELTVFIDINNNQIYEPLTGENLIRTKKTVRNTDKLQYGLGRKRVKFAPTGRTSGWGSNGTFKYCPKDHEEISRAIRVATSGRFYVSSDWDGDGKDELRNGSEIQCRP